MKKILTLLFLCFFVVQLSKLQAQGHYDGQSSIGLSAGIQSNNTFIANLNFQKEFSSSLFGIRADLLFNNSTEKIKVVVPEDYKLNTYGLGLSTFYSFKNKIKYPFYLNIFLGVNYVYEYLNNGVYTNSLGIPFQQPNINTYGLYGGAELEYILYKNISLALTTLNQYNFNSSFTKGRVSGSLGLKYNF